MKRIFITTTFLMGCLYSYAQDITQVIPISEDSAHVLVRQIDEMSYFDLKKIREHFIYRKRIEPNNQNTELLLYIEEKLNATSK